MQVFDFSCLFFDNTCLNFHDVFSSSEFNHCNSQSALSTHIDDDHTDTPQDQGAESDTSILSSSPPSPATTGAL